MNRFAFRPYLLVVWAFVVILASATGVERFTLLAYSIGCLWLVFLLCFLWPAKWTIRGRLLSSEVAIPVALGLILSAAITSWPLRLEFVLVRPALNALAVRVRHKDRIALPVRIGLLRIREVGVSRSGVVCLWTDSNPDGKTGFVQTTREGAGEFNLWSSVAVGSDWQFISED